MLKILPPLRTLLAGLAILASLSSCTSAFALPCEKPARLRFSLVPEGAVDRDLEAFAPLLADLRAALSMPVDAVRPASYGSVIEGLLAGALDVARLGPASYVTARAASRDIVPFATYVVPAGAFQPEGPAYHALLIASRSSTRQSLEALRGQSLALVDPESTSGSVVPRALFREVAGVPLEHYFGRIGYTGSHNASIQAVASHKVDAAFVASVHLSSLIEQGKLRKQDLVALWRSPSLPMDAFVYRAGLCPGIRQKIEEVFLRFHERHPRQTLKALDALRFVPTDDAAYDVIRALRGKGT